jgi:hypothetical protein
VAEALRARGHDAATVHDQHLQRDQPAGDACRAPEQDRDVEGPVPRVLAQALQHRLDVTLRTDRSDPARPPILAVARGKDTAAAQTCWDLLSEEQRPQVRTHRVDMGSADPAACATRLKNSRAGTDRFPGAQTCNEVVDTLRQN